MFNSTVEDYKKIAEQAVNNFAVLQMKYTAKCIELNKLIPKTPKTPNGISKNKLNSYAAKNMKMSNKVSKLNTLNISLVKNIKQQKKEIADLIYDNDIMRCAFLNTADKGYHDLQIAHVELQRKFIIANQRVDYLCLYQNAKTHKIREAQEARAIKKAERNKIKGNLNATII